VVILVAGSLMLLALLAILLQSIMGRHGNADPLAKLTPFPIVNWKDWPVALPPPPGSLAGELAISPGRTYIEGMGALSAGQTWAYAFHHPVSFVNHHFYYQSLLRESGFRVLVGRDQLEIESLESIDVRWAEQYIDNSGSKLVTFCLFHDPQVGDTRYEVYVEERPDIPAELYNKAFVIADDAELRMQFNKMLRRDAF
jgi:hypothetical protein